MINYIGLLFWRFRVLLFYFVTVLLCLIIVFPSMLLRSFLSYSAKYKICHAFSFLYILSCRFICSLKYEVQGIDKLPNIPSVVLSNHQSFWENIFMQILIPQHSWVIKQEINNIPFFGPAFIKCLDPIKVDRKNPLSAQNIVKGGIERIKKGLWVLIFPEATRVPINRNISIKPIGVKLAKMAKAPIVIVVHNAGLYWPPTSFWIKSSGTIKVKIEDVIYPEKMQNLDVRQLNKKVEAIMHKAKNELINKRVDEDSN